MVERDYNAALNILDEGLRIMGNIVPNYINQIGSSTTEFTLVENPTMDDPIRNDLLKSSGSMKQEVNNEQI